MLTKYGPATVIGIEDLILKRLASAKHWRYPSDVEQTYLVAKARQDMVDGKYVEGEAREASTLDYLRKLRRMPD